MKQCFGYVRVSTKEQGKGVSLDAQKDAIQSYASKNGTQITEWFEEEVTAAKQGRPTFNRMVNALKRQKADGVIFHKIDRSSRNPFDWARITELSDQGVFIRFAADDVDLQSRSGLLSANFQQIIAADYVRNLREEIKKGQMGLLKAGLITWAAPIGYRNHGKGKPKTPDAKQAPLVRKMFELYATGNFSYDTLVGEMSARGLRNTVGKPLNRRCIERTLRNPFYAGVILVNRTGQTFPGKHQPIISTKLFQKVERVRKGRTRSKVSTKHHYRYRGIFKCAYCGYSMIGERQKGRVYYRCQQKGCPTTTVREDTIDAKFEDHLGYLQLRKVKVDAIRQKFVNWLTSISDIQKAEDASFELDKIKQRLSRLSDKFVDDLIDQSTYETKRKEILLLQADWERRLRNMRKMDWHMARLDGLLELLSKPYLHFQIADPNRKREIVRFIGSNFLVSGREPYIEPPNWFLRLSDPERPLLCTAQTQNSNPLEEWEDVFNEFDRAYRSRTEH